VREELLNAKARDLQAELETWIETNKIELNLQPGEKLVCSLRIERTPVVSVVREDAIDPALLPLAHFFSRDRLHALGMDKRRAARTNNLLGGHTIYVQGRERTYPTMADFLKDFPSTAHMFRTIQNMGRRELPAIAKLIRAAGLPLEPSPYDDE
jgi:hypothetical protein